MPVNPEVLKRAAETRDRSLETLKGAVASGSIRNADLESLKFELSNAWYEESRALPDLLGRPDHPHTEMDRHWYRIVQLPPYTLVHVKVIPKRLPGILKTIGQPDDRITAAAEAVMILHDRWLPLAELLAEVKPLIVKGRKPSETPADPRTLENTGTCSCCERNVKLKDLRIVDHGFQVSDGRHGQCFGVGYYPIEISTEGLVELVKSLERGIQTSSAYLRRLENDEVDTFYIDPMHRTEKVDRDHPKFARARSAEMDGAKMEIANYRAQIKIARERIDGWVPRKLPDGAEHFALAQDAEGTPGTGMSM